MTESGQGGGPQGGAPWGPDPAYPAQPDPESGRPEQQPGQPGQQPAQPGQAPAYGYPAQGGPAYGYPQAVPGAGHVVGPGYEGPGEPHGYGYPPLPEAVTQYIPPVPAGPVGPAGPAGNEAATQYIPPVPAAPAGAAHDEAATQYIPPVPADPAGPAHDEAATQYIPPVPAGPAGPAHHEAATQYIPPVPAAEFDGLFRDSSGDGVAGHTQQLPPVQEPVLRQPPRPRPPRGQGPVPQQQYQPPQQYQQQQPPPPRQQYAPPPPPPETSRKVSPAVIVAGVVGLVVVGLGVGSLLGDGKPQNNDPGAVSSAPSASGSAASGEAPVDPARPQAVQLDKLLADSNDSRASVIKAVEDIKSCKNLDQAAGDLRDAARQREELVTRLQELKVDQLPDHAKLSAALTKAWQSSAAADNSYAAWAGDVGGDKGCKDGKAKSTDNASAGNKASGEATKAKESAAGLWNTIAAKYGLTKRDKSQL